MLKSLSFILSFLCISAVAAAETLCISSEENFLATLQSAVAKADKKAVANLIHLPLRTSKTQIKTKKSFLEKYDFLFNPGVTKAVKDANFDNLFRRDQGSMIGNGEVWFNDFAEQSCFKIITINDDLGRR